MNPLLELQQACKLEGYNVLLLHSGSDVAIVMYRYST